LSSSTVTLQDMERTVRKAGVLELGPILVVVHRVWNLVV
jgi:hypothetical protein